LENLGIRRCPGAAHTHGKRFWSAAGAGARTELLSSSDLLLGDISGAITELVKSPYNQTKKVFKKF